LDIFSQPVPDVSGKLRPVLILVHGGGWSRGTRDALAPHARYFAARGWVCVNISYRLTSEPGITLNEAQADVRAALAWVRSEAEKRGWDPARICALGESAGGQLVCALGLLPPEPEKWRVHSLVLVNPVLDLTTLSWALNTQGLREAGPVNPATAASHPAGMASPLFHLTRDEPPILLLHGRKDVTVPVAQAEAFAARAKTVGASVELVVLEDSAHAFLLRELGRPEEIRAALRRIADFLPRPE
jgi:acetyl esterase/lipase